MNALIGPPRASKPPLVRRLGCALFGSRYWQSALAETLHVNLRTVRRWTTGEEEPPPGVWHELVALAAVRRSELADLIDKIRRYAPGEPPSPILSTPSRAGFEEG